MVAPQSVWPDSSAMERWLGETCTGCRHGETIDGQAGIGCVLPALAYAEPNTDRPEWTAHPGATHGVRCTWRDAPPQPQRKPEPQLPGQAVLFDGA